MLNFFDFLKFRSYIYRIIGIISKHHIGVQRLSIAYKLCSCIISFKKIRTLIIKKWILLRFISITFILMGCQIWIILTTRILTLSLIIFYCFFCSLSKTTMKSIGTPSGTSFRQISNTYCRFERWSMKISTFG